MSRGPYPLMLMLAMSLPSTVRALGLGDIHVDSALNEPLSAQIDLIGATPQELLDLRAAIANKDIFQRYNADRPAFLNSAKFKVGRDPQGRPVLTVHSEDAFTDPLVSLLVDLRWPHGQVVREYSLLLDPPGFNSHPDSMLAAAPAPARPAASAAALPLDAPTPHAAMLTPAAHPAPAAYAGLAAGHYRVADKDTLRGIARRAGAVSEADAQRLMIAIFRANPHAFAGNINRLHRGADLLLPGPDVVDAIAAADAKREVRAHMSAWRLDGRPAAVESTAPAAAVAVAATAATAPPTSTPSTELLKGRVQSLEQSLDDMKKILASEDAKMLGLQKQVSRAVSAEPASASQTMATTAATFVSTAAAAAAEPEPSAMVAMAATAATAAPAHQAAQAFDAGSSLAGRVGPFAALAGVLVAGFALFRYRRLEKLARPMQLTEAELTNTAVLDETQSGSPTLAREAAKVTAALTAAAATPPKPVPAAATPLMTASSDMPSFPKMPAKLPSGDTTRTMGIPSRGMEELALDAADLDPYGIDTAATAKLPVAGSSRQSISVDAQALAAADLDFNLLDLGATGEHVQMPSGLHDHVVVAESRTNIVEVLKGAIDRDPQRRDLRIKLLEVYYSAASTNQRAFIEVAAGLSHEREHLSRDEWDKVARMGREIAAGNGLFKEHKDGDALAVA